MSRFAPASAGANPSKKVFTTRPDPAGTRPSDLVERRFTATAPRQLWVADITYVRTWSGFAYVAFVTDVFSRRIVGFNVASTLKADILPLQALDMAAFAAGGDLTGLTHHSDSETVRAGVLGGPDPHADGRARMLVPGVLRGS